MKKRAILSIALAVFIVGVFLLAEAQEHKAPRIWRIGWLSPTASPTGAIQLDALRKGLSDLCYVEGRNITSQARGADDASTRLPRLARALVELNVNVICSSGTPATLAAKQTSTTIPIVFGQAVFPDRTGLVANL